MDFPRKAGGWAGCALVLAGLGFSRHAYYGGPLTAAAFLWLASAAVVLSGAFLLARRAAARAWPGQPGESLRWFALACGAIAINFPFWSRDGIGAGDAYWYTLMIADFTEQVRHGFFPVWIGQSRFAFNGAVTPLRLAPWVQHLAAAIDLLTAHVLDPIALKNAVAAFDGLAIAASAYFCLRRVLPRRPGLACALALLWVAGPGVAAPIMVLDQYMMYSAIPFLPPLLLGCWEFWIEPARWRPRALVAISLAGLWLAHTPMAFWGSLLAAAVYLAGLGRFRPWNGEGWRLAGMAALFLALGAFPLGSAFSIDRAVHIGVTGAEVPDQIRNEFPGNFRPLHAEHLQPGTCQLGYTLLALALASLVLLAWKRPRGGGIFVAAILAVVPLALPVPGLMPWIWNHAPNWFVAVQNVWPTQRLIALWGLFIVFGFAVAAREERVGGLGILRVALALGMCWTANQGSELVRALGFSRVEAKSAEVGLRPENLILTRYPYATFAEPPGYASHGYMDPYLENRLLDSRTGELVAADADAAAPADGAAGRLVQSGNWTAVSTVHNRIYTLEPGFSLEPGVAYALRVEGVAPNLDGILQVLGTGELFREYILPDSGVAIHDNSSFPLAFGSFPTSSRVVSLLFHGPAPIEPVLQFVRPKYEGDRFEFGRFRLYRYRPQDLPVRVTSWIPYKAEVYAPRPALLETPRVWQRGWHAQVNGREAPVVISHEHLVAVPVPTGHSHVVVVFRATWWLDAWYWLTFLGWSALLCAALGRLVLAGAPGLRRA